MRDLIRVTAKKKEQMSSDNNEAVVLLRTGTSDSRPERICYKIMDSQKNCFVASTLYKLTCERVQWKNSV